MTWPQIYDPFGNPALSTFAAALPLVVLLGTLAMHRIPAHVAALLGLATALLVALFAFHMPATPALAAAGMGVAYGLFPIGWIVVNVIFLHTLAKDRGLLDDLEREITGLSSDRRVQLLVVAFAFGAFFEGAAGFGTPVAVTSALLIALGFAPLEACGLSLIANTAPVAFGALGTPVVSLGGVTGLDVKTLSAMIGRQLPPFALLVPFWLLWAYDGWKGVRERWGAALVAGLAFAIPQALVANLHGPWLVDVIASLCSLGALTIYARSERGTRADSARPGDAATRRRALLPWILLTVIVFIWGLPATKKFLNGVFAPSIAVPGLDGVVQRVPPIVPAATSEAAKFSLNILSATGTAILISALITALLLRIRPADVASAFGRTMKVSAKSLVTIAAMMALGFVTRYGGLDGTLGLAFAHTGRAYPFFGTMLGWMGVALTGSDTSSNVLFGSLQTITATQLGLSAVLMAAANSSGGVMGKMIDAQSIVVAGAATGWTGHEGRILRFVFRHSVALAVLVAGWVLLQAYVWPFSALVPR